MIRTEIMDRVKAVAATPAFATPQWWLTFYISGDVQQLEYLGQRLLMQGAVNTQGCKGGFIYPKLNIDSDPVSVAQVIADVQLLAAKFDVNLLAVDADTSADVRRSNFEELVRF